MNAAERVAQGETPPAPDRVLRILGFAGSLRRGSLNRALLRAASELAPQHARIVPFDIAGIPLYNGDLDNDDARPAAVTQFKQAVTDADAVLVVSPEYNYGAAGVTKNVLDWASRPSYRSPFLHKPCGLMGAAPGRSGTMRGQEQVKLHLLGMAALVYPHPGVAVSTAREKFDGDLRLTDEDTREFVRKYLNGFAEWARRMIRS